MLKSATVLAKASIGIAFLTALTVWNGCGADYQSVSSFHVYSTVDTSRAAIGDVVRFQIWAKGTGERRISFPPMAIEDSDILVVERRDLEGDNSDDIGMEFQITFWDTGRFELPAYTVNVMNTDNDSIDYAITTDPVAVTVESVVTDPQPSLRAIKEPVPIPILVPYRIILSLAAIVILLGFLLWIWRKRVVEKREPPLVQIPSRPPIDIAWEKLENLRQAKLDSPDEVKEFYAALSHIVREYMEYQFFIRAMEMTTSEIEMARDLFPLESEDVDPMLDILKRADLAKFARFQPEKGRSRKDIVAISEFIEKTRVHLSLVENGVTKAEVL
ncbi:MAG: hypothetical protein QF613_07940 [Candidatus Marinimicrobia bacterium]|jgi:hypothetical protein|nr:hypothetical protein [Candidatus Neomarinimicrobiota bacterium]MDP6594113.1 hypothetical protein [Candidatus Neomarinimicrobiota bacterium]|tara:strand:+ start:22223 stop:23212 length:990 start_codon:yes stop_codon:yes gene_type:complete